MSIDQLTESIPSQTLPTMVYNKVREAILNGVFGPGQMLRQDEVASKLGVSRSPLREALPRLEADGIVVLHPRRGYAVASLDPAQAGVGRRATAAATTGTSWQNRWRSERSSSCTAAACSLDS